jgi:hypothetical protein
MVWNTKQQKTPNFEPLSDTIGSESKVLDFFLKDSKTIYDPESNSVCPLLFSPSPIICYLMTTTSLSILWFKPGTDMRLSNVDIGP